QRVAIGALVHNLRPALKGCTSACSCSNSRHQILSDMLFGQKSQWQFCTGPMHFQFLHEASQWMSIPIHLRWPIGANEQETSQLRPPRKTRDDIEGRVIAPMEIFQNQYEWSLYGEGFYDLGNLAQHAFLGSFRQLALQSLSFGKLDQCGHLQQPGRRKSAQQGDESLSPRLATEAV